MNHDDLPLFAWSPPACQVIAFPLQRQIGKVRDVARKMAEKTTARHADYYRNQVSDALFKRMERLGVPETVQDEMVGAFWRGVEFEIARIRATQQRQKPNHPGGVA